LRKKRPEHRRDLTSARKESSMASRKSKAKNRNRSRPNPRPIPQRAVPQRSGDADARDSVEAEAAALKPKQALDERVEDIAVFANVGREQLSDELKIDCTAVMEALDLTYEGDFVQANDRLKNIARSSPYADWRLFVRGLCGFCSSDYEAARQNWQRLDATRRPARIAATLLSAQLNEPLGDIGQRPKRLIESAKALLHRPSVIAAAKQIAAVKHRDPDVKFTASQVAMLINFRDDFRKVDKKFVTDFSQACVYLSCTQETPDSFMLLKKSVPGPPHDPRWNLQQFQYLQDFDDIEEELFETVEAYIGGDLPKLTHISGELKKALSSCMLLALARYELGRAQDAGFPFTFSYEPPDYKSIEKQLHLAVKAYATNREAHDFLIEILEKQLKARRITKAQSLAIEKRLVSAKDALVAAFPSEIETSLQLVDYYFDEDEIDKANKLVAKLSSLRLEAPLAKALPWKVKLREAMSLTRTKTGLPASRVALDAAESVWPTWLSRDWLLFLRAAWEMRSGNQAQFESLDRAARAACGASQVVGDFMTFAALQQMNLPGPALKPLRETITQYVANAEKQSLADLISIGGFFWDLVRTGLQHKGYRMQASKLGKALVHQMNRGEKVVRSETFIGACCWCANFGFWQSGYEPKSPEWFKPIAETEPKAAAVFVAWIAKDSYSVRQLIENRSLIELVGDAAKTEKDPFYRFRFEVTAAEARQAISDYEAKRRPPQGWYSDNDTYDDDDDDDDDNEVCYCPKCVAERERQAANDARSRSSQKAQSKPEPLPSFLKYDDEDDDDDEEFFDEEEDDDLGFDSTTGPQIANEYFARLAAKLGLGGMEALLNSLKGEDRKAERAGVDINPITTVMKVFKLHGLTREDAVEFLRMFEQQMEVDSPELDSPQLESPQRVPMTPEERRAADKKRRKELESKRKKQRR
jgi:hypothetical protein